MWLWVRVPLQSLKTSDFAPVSSKEFLDIQATIEPGFTLKRVRDMIRTYSHLGKIFAEHKLIDFKRQPSNLKRLLCSSYLSSNKPIFRTTKCGKCLWKNRG